MSPREPKPKTGNTPSSFSATTQKLARASYACRFQCFITVMFSEYLTLRKDVGLNVSVIVLASPHKGSGRLQHLGDHIVDKPVLIPDLQFVKLWLVIPAEDNTIRLFIFFFLKRTLK